MPCERLHFVLQSDAMEVSRAIADLEEVRTRLAAVQRFRGLSGRRRLRQRHRGDRQRPDPSRRRPASRQRRRGARYVAIWIACLACSLAVNYGAIVVWLARHWSVRSRVELKTVGHDDLAVDRRGRLVHRGASIARGELGLLPGMWCLCYALGLIASRAMAPPRHRLVAALFAASGAALLFAPGNNALAWWVMPATFGVGQIVDRRARVARCARRRRDERRRTLRLLPVSNASSTNADGSPSARAWSPIPTACASPNCKKRAR